MYQTTANVLKNRLYIVIKGFNTDDEVKKLANDVIENAKKLRKGFDVIDDISEMTAVSQEASKDIARMQHFLVEHGMHRLIRIVGESLAHFQFTRTGKEAGYQKEAETTFSVNEAERMLETDKNLGTKPEGPKK